MCVCVCVLLLCSPLCLLPPSLAFLPPSLSISVVVLVVVALAVYAYGENIVCVCVLECASEFFSFFLFLADGIRKRLETSSPPKQQQQQQQREQHTAAKRVAVRLTATQSSLRPRTSRNLCLLHHTHTHTFSFLAHRHIQAATLQTTFLSAASSVWTRSSSSHLRTSCALRVPVNI